MDDLIAPLNFPRRRITSVALAWLGTGLSGLARYVHEDQALCESLQDLFIPVGREIRGADRRPALILSFLAQYSKGKNIQMQTSAQRRNSMPFVRWVEVWQCARR